MIEIRTDNPHGFVERLNTAISAGRTAVWGVDNDGDYYLRASEWRGKGWMRPLYKDDEPQILRFAILEPKGQNLSKATYSVLHCRLAELLLSLFDTSIASLSISPMLTRYDIYSHN